MINKPNILISGGGTGGHIFPAIAIASELEKRYPESNILFVGAKDKMEMQKVPEAGFKIKGLWISGFQRKLSFKNLLFPIKLVHSYWSAVQIVRNFKPHIAVGTGGFASGPTLKAAAQFGVATVIQEQNSYPGVTNKILAKKAKKICVAYDGMEKYFPVSKVVMTGNPVRKNIFNHNIDRNEAATKYFTTPSDKIVLVVGGSLGSRTFNNCMKVGLQKLNLAGIQVIWQTGQMMYNDCKKYTENNRNVFVTDFISNMADAYAAADIIISRAGAIAISELCLAGKPAILVPFPYAAEDHQTKNAMALVKHNAAIHIADAEAALQLVPTTISLFNDIAKRKLLSASIKPLGIADATDRIVDEIEKLLG